MLAARFDESRHALPCRGAYRVQPRDRRAGQILLADDGRSGMLADDALADEDCSPAACYKVPMAFIDSNSLGPLLHYDCRERFDELYAKGMGLRGWQPDDQIFTELVVKLCQSRRRRTFYPS